MKKTSSVTRRIFACLLTFVYCFCLALPAIPAVQAETVKVYGPNLVANNGTMDNILGQGENERTLNSDWVTSYPVATFGGVGGDSPAKIKNVDSNNVIALEFSTGAFASFFADLYSNGVMLPAGTYRLSMELLPVGENFRTDNVGFNLVNQYSDIRIYDNGWQNCTQLDGGWLRYEAEFAINAESVDSIQFWFNTMGSSILYIDNLSICTVTEGDAVEEPDSGVNLIANNGTMDNILAQGESERILNADWVVSYPVATFGGVGGDSPAKIKNVDGNNVIALEYSTGAFASFFADLYADGVMLPAGTYTLSMDLLPIGDDFQTDNVGFNLVGQYNDIRVYVDGWKNCTQLDNGWLRYTSDFIINANSVDSIQFWMNTMGSSALYIDNLSICKAAEQPLPEEPVFGTNLVANNGSFDKILINGEFERTLNTDWIASAPAGTFGCVGGDSPAKIKNVDGNNVLALEYSTGAFASFFADLYAWGDKLPAGSYRLSMDLLPIGDNFQTDNVGFHLMGQYNDVRIYNNGWKSCTRLENGWIRYEADFAINANSVDSIQMWINTMGTSALHVDNLSMCQIEPSSNLVANDGTMDRILALDETERTLDADWIASAPVGTFGGVGSDSPAKIKNVDGNNVIALEYSTGAFASFFADLYANGDKLPAGTYTLSMDLLPVGEDFQTDNIGFHLVGQYSEIRIYNQGWVNCTELENGWLHYEIEIPISANSVDSIQLWFNTMESSVLYIDNLSMCNIADDKDPVGSVKEWGLTLSDNICAEFVVDISAGTANAIVSVNGNTVKEATVTNGSKLSVDLAAAQMTDVISIRFADADGNESKTYQYTIRQYCDYILTGSYSNATKGLVSAMLSYGGRAQVYFDYHTDHLADERIAVSQLAVPSEAPTSMVTGQASGVNFYGATLVHENRIALRLYFKLTDGQTHSFTNANGSVTYTPIFKDGLYYVEVSNITPAMLDETYTICVDGTLTVVYGPTDYILRMYNKASSSQETKDVMAALYSYWNAAEAYVYSLVGGESVDIPQDGYTNHSASIKYVKNLGQITGQNGFTNTAERFGVFGADLGIPVYDNQMQRLMLLFGDTYSEADYSGNWRSNVALYTTQQDYSNGIAFTGALTASGAAPSGMAVQLTPGANSSTPLLQGNASMHQSAHTCIPTGSIILDGTTYIFYMEIHKDGFKENGDWKVYYNRVIKSTDHGESWQQVSGLSWQTLNILEMDTDAANFAQIYPLRAGDYVYLYGLRGGRFGGTKLARVAVGQFEDINAYEYFVGYAENGDAQWQKGSDGLKNSDYIISDPCGEMCVTYNAYLRKYLAIYQSGDKLVYRTANTPYGVFSAPETILTTSGDMSAAYGAFTCEQLSNCGGQRIWILVSEWSPIYNVSQVEIVFN